MPKTIQWNAEFEKEVLEESTGTIHIAVRPGRLYFDTKYFKKGDIVDIRIGNKVVRKAMIQDDPKLLQLNELGAPDYNLLKTSINNKENLKNFLKKNYKIELNDTSEITVIPYNNMNLVYSKDNVDPHFC